MDRSTIFYLHHKGWSNSAIATFMGHHRDTISRVLREPVDKPPTPRQRTRAVAVFTDQIHTWLEQQWTVQRMREEARQHPTHPYTGGVAAFYDFVRPLKRSRTQTPNAVPIRFDGLPGELLQIDWGEVRAFPFTHPDLGQQTRYCFAARLKYSRWMGVRFTTDMREETLLRCLVAVFVAMGGVPWVVTTDNMKTVTTGRDAQHKPIWHPAFAQCAAEFGFLPDACSLNAGNQKGAVESLVQFVKQHFLLGRTFHDDTDRAETGAAWLQPVNTERPSDATETPPAARLGAEQAAFSRLPASATAYGFFDTVTVSRESLVTIATNRYAVPIAYIGQVLTVRISPTRIARSLRDTLVASHPRHHGRHARIIIPEHDEAVFARKPRARVMAYRDWLVQRSETAAAYISQLCRKRYAEMDAQMGARYDLAQQVGIAEFLAALDLAHGQHLFGVEYVQAILAQPPVRPPTALEYHPTLPLALPMPQHAVERALVQYEQYVANASLPLGGGQ